MRLSAILLLTVGFWANFLCCCQGAQSGHCGQTTAAAAAQTSDSEMGTHCEMASGQKSHCQEQTANRKSDQGPIAKAPCNCQKHRLALTAVIMVSKGETQIPTAPLNLFMKPWTLGAIPNQHMATNFPESFRAPPDGRRCPSLSALGRFLI